MKDGYTRERTYSPKFDAPCDSHQGRINTGRASVTSSKSGLPSPMVEWQPPPWRPRSREESMQNGWWIRKRAHVTVSTSNAASDPVIPDLSGLPFTYITYLTLLPPTSSLPTTSNSLQVLPTGESLLLENGDEGATDQDCSLYKEVGAVRSIVQDVYPHSRNNNGRILSPCC